MRRLLKGRLLESVGMNEHGRSMLPFVLLAAACTSASDAEPESSTVGALQDEGSSFQLPWVPGVTAMALQGPGGSFSHGNMPGAWDFGLPFGTPVQAVDDGVVDRATDGCVDYANDHCGDGFGNQVIVQHGGGVYSFYGHIQRGGVRVRPGQRVSAGDTLGLSGSTGFSTGPHLHFHFQRAGGLGRIGGEQIPYLDATSGTGFRGASRLQVNGRYTSVGVAPNDADLTPQARAITWKYRGCDPNATTPCPVPARTAFTDRLGLPAHGRIRALSGKAPPNVSELYFAEFERGQMYAYRSGGNEWRVFEVADFDGAYFHSAYDKRLVPNGSNSFLGAPFSGLETDASGRHFQRFMSGRCAYQMRVHPSGAIVIDALLPSCNVPKQAAELPNAPAS